MTSTIVRQRIFRTGIPILTVANKKQAPFFWALYIFYFHRCCRQMQSHFVLSLPWFSHCRNAPHFDNSEYWAASLHLLANQRDKTLQHIDISLSRETVSITICFQICHANTSFIQTAVFAKKHLCCQGIQNIKPIIATPRRKAPESKKYQYIQHLNNQWP